MIGHVLLSRGDDEHGDDVIAMWQVNTEGTSTGAWTMSSADALADPDIACGRVGGTTRRRLCL